MARAKIDRRILKTKRAIICALLKLRKTKSLDDISITALTNTADVNRKTFYLHYKSVEDVSREFESYLVQKLREVREDASDPVCGLSASVLFTRFQELIAQYPEIFNALFTKTVMPLYLYPLQDEIVNTYEGVLAQTHNCSPDDLRSRVIFVISGVVSLYLDWSSRPAAVEPSALVEQLTHLAVLTFSDCRIQA